MSIVVNSACDDDGKARPSNVEEGVTVVSDTVVWADSVEPSRISLSSTGFDCVAVVG